MAVDLVGEVPQEFQAVGFSSDLAAVSPRCCLDFQPGLDYFDLKRVGQGLGLIETGGYSMETGYRPSRHDLGGV